MMILPLLLFLTRPVSSFETRHQVNYGVMFEELPPLYAAQDFWSHTFVIDTLPKVALESHLYKCDCPLYSKVFQKLTAMQDETINIATQTSSEILDLVDDISDFESRKVDLHTTRTKTKRRSPYGREPRSITKRSSDCRNCPEYATIAKRLRRTLIPFLPKKHKKIKGRARSKLFVQKLAAHLKNVEITSRNLVNNFNHGQETFTSFMSTSNTRMREAFQQIEDTHVLLQQVESQIQTNLTSTEKFHAWLLTILVEQFEHHNSVSISYMKLFEGFVSVLNGLLSPLILDQSNLLDVIRNISRSIERQYPKWKLVHTTPGYYYNHADFTVHKRNSAILLTLRFPISTLHQPFRLFRISTFPVPIDTHSAHGTSITHLPDYMAFSDKDASQYITPNSDVLFDCDKDPHFIHCHFNMLLKSGSEVCATALFNGNTSDILDICTFDFLPNSVVPNIIPVNTSHYLLVNISSGTVSCNSSVTRRISCQFCIVHLPCYCELTSPVTFIQERVADCADEDVSVSYPVNLVFLQKYFGFNATSNISANDSLETPTNLPVQPIVLQSYSYLDHSTHTQPTRFDLDIAIKAIKQGNPVYDFAKAHALISDDTSKILQLAFILSLFAICLSMATVLLICGICIYFKLYRHMSMCSKCTSSNGPPRPVTRTTSAILIRSTSLPAMTLCRQTSYHNALRDSYAEKNACNTKRKRIE